MTDERREYSYKLVVLGHYSVGKTSLVMKYVKNQFNPNEESTIGAAFMTKTVLYPSFNVKYEIWDTAGQERYNSLIPMYYRGAHVALIIYDITSTESFEVAKRWVEELSQEKPENFLKVMVGNKSDLENTCRRVSTEEASELAKEKNLVFFESSAKTGFNIERIFTHIGEILPKKNVEKQKTVVKTKTNSNKYGCC
ncbi:RAS-related protein RAB5 [Spraguea lophii 42_110]|uniref:RAS-related protein RAB5 n=1 Tax=Spraguea lophii (strain 42_110) TaxID=1358809 RepID=S7XRW0_SPRLO|nr:RAS-related protein RAB5 [Spraguea lophii 42_110]